MLPAAAQELWKALRKADRKAAKARVVALRKRLPDADNEELHRLLVQSKCLQAGAFGALSAVVELVPGAGRVAGVFLGSVIDIGTVTALQSELVLETFALYDVELGDAGERFAILAIAATNVGATHASSIVAKLLKRYAGALIGGFVLKRALPVTKIATVATKNIALTYAIGMRAQAVAKFRDADLGGMAKADAPGHQYRRIDAGRMGHQRRAHGDRSGAGVGQVLGRAGHRAAAEPAEFPVPARPEALCARRA